MYTKQGIWPTYLLVAIVMPGMRQWGVAATLLLVAASLAAQTDLLFSGLTDVQQGLALNPARSQRYKLSIGLPGVAADYYNGGFKAGVFRTNEAIRTQIGNAVEALRPGQNLSTEARVDVFGLSAKLPTGHLTVSLSQRLQLHSQLPVDGIEYLYAGDDYGLSEGVRINDQRSTGIAYAELALGYQLPTNDKVRVGGRLRLLHGQAHGKVIDGQISTVTTDTGTYIRATALLRSSGVASPPDERDQERTTRDVLAGPLNPGVGLDFGLVTEPGNGWKFGISLLDLGLIRFKHRTQDYFLNGDLSTPGLRALSGPDDEVGVVLDTLAEIFQDIKAEDFTEEVSYIDPYTQVLMPRVVLSAERALNASLGVGAHYSGRVRPLGMSHALMLYSRARLGSWLQATIGYGLRDRAYNQLGAGLEMRLGPLQLYASSDNLLDLILLDRLEASSGRIGANLVFPMPGDRSGRKAGRDVKCYRFN